MKSFSKKFFILIFTLLYTITFIPYPAQASTSKDIHIIQDSESISDLPQHFRKTNNINDIAKLKSLNLIGMDKLNISGSGQFTEFNLPLIQKEIGNDFSIIDVDLREESHGFINGIAISFANSKNNANKGLSYDDIIATENKNLSSIKINEPLTIFNTNKTITPIRVENENQLVTNKNISYLRIPVTDGELPNDDMVKYFVDFVNNQPENTWLHFHCKAGVGRTTTFMIMYDIIKNCNQVNLNDIIARQVLLSRIRSRNAVDFFIGKRYKFLKDFYNDCKNNCLETCSLNMTNDCINPINENSDIYIKNSIIPKTLYIIDENNMTKAEQTMISTLQGLIASKTDTQIYVLTSSEPDYKIWLNDLKNDYKIKYKIIKNPWKLVMKFKSYVNGYVLYSTSNPSSINNACTLASLEDSLAIDESIELILNNHGINNLVKDCRDTDKYWAYNTLWNSGLNHSTVIELSPDKYVPLRDYAMISKSLIFYEDDVTDYDLREKIFSSMDDNGHILGWGPDEHGNVSLASKYGVNMVASDWSYNLSVLSSFPLKSQTQKAKADIEKDGFHYVTFIMSDGDNAQWLLGSNYNNKNWFGSPYRGRFNLGWSLNPSLYYLAPTVFNKYYENASSKEYNDNFVVAPSGNGYIYPSKFPSDELDNYTKILNDYMAKVDQHNVLILDDEAFYRKDLWDKYTSHTNIEGLLYLNYDKNNSYEGQIIWSNNKPVVSCRDLLWSGLEDENQLISNINNRISSGYTRINDPNSYTFVYVHIWSNTMDNVYDVVNKLNKNPKVKIVTPDNFMRLIQRNLAESQPF